VELQSQVGGVWRQGSVHEKPLSLLLTIAPSSEGASGLVREICAELLFRGWEGGGNRGNEEILSTLQWLV
jgi:hypothetical protein